MSERTKRLTEKSLQIHLPRINYVIDPFRATKRRRIAFTIRGRRGPQFDAIGLMGKTPIVEIAPEQSKLPKLVRNVFPDVGDDAVGSDDDLFARFLF